VEASEAVEVAAVEAVVGTVEKRMLSVGVIMPVMRA
jgi:hypothetical protein